jgi:hypothetical protein
VLPLGTQLLNLGGVDRRPRLVSQLANHRKRGLAVPGGWDAFPSNARPNANVLIQPPRLIAVKGSVIPGFLSLVKAVPSHILTLVLGGEPSANVHFLFLDLTPIKRKQ